MRCGFKRTEVWFGPRGGIHSKIWQCSKKGKYLFFDTDSCGGNPKQHCLCTIHLRIAKRAS